MDKYAILKEENERLKSDKEFIIKSYEATLEYYKSIEDAAPQVKDDKYVLKYKKIKEILKNIFKGL